MARVVSNLEFTSGHAAGLPAAPCRLVNGLASATTGGTVADGVHPHKALVTPSRVSDQDSLCIVLCDKAIPHTTSVHLAAVRHGVANVECSFEGNASSLKPGLALRVVEGAQAASPTDCASLGDAAADPCRISHSRARCTLLSVVSSRGKKYVLRVWWQACTVQGNKLGLRDERCVDYGMIKDSSLSENSKLECPAWGSFEFVQGTQYLKGRPLAANEDYWQTEPEDAARQYKTAKKPQPTHTIADLGTANTSAADLLKQGAVMGLNDNVVAAPTSVVEQGPLMGLRDDVVASAMNEDVAAPAVAAAPTKTPGPKKPQTFKRRKKSVQPPPAKN